MIEINAVIVCLLLAIYSEEIFSDKLFVCLLFGGLRILKQLCSFGLLAFICVTQSAPAFATEVIVANCPDGVIVVSDKRATDAEGKFKDNTKKICLARNYLFGRVGGFVTAADAKSGKKIPIHLKFIVKDGLFPVYDNDLLEESTLRTISRNVVNQLAKFRVKNSDCEFQIPQDIYFFFLKRNEKIGGVDFAIFTMPHLSGNLGLDISFDVSYTRTIKPGKSFCFVMGTDQSKPSNLFKSSEEGLLWCEKEIAHSHKNQKEPYIGNTVDEYLYEFQGKIKTLAINKKVCGAVANLKDEYRLARPLTQNY